MKTIKNLLVVCFALLALGVMASCVEVTNCEHETGSWAANAEEHWKTCSLCNEQVEKGAHQFGEYEILSKPAVGIEGSEARKCKDCGSIMKDNWDYCPFCKYLPEIKKKGKKRNNINAK